VVASDVRMNREHAGAGPFVYCDVQDKDNLARIILENGITTVVHLATLLSGAEIFAAADFREVQEHLQCSIARQPLPSQGHL
jgi:hypothetical protein